MLDETNYQKSTAMTSTASFQVFACYEASCRPPTSGGTGGSSPAGPLGSVQPILKALTQAGGTPFVVGGFVRDQILGKGSKDLDIEVHGIPADKVARVLRQFGKVDEVGKSFGVLKVRFGGEDLDISLPRTDSKTGEGHTGFEISVDPHMGIEKALARRDFTINAIAMDPQGNIVDPHGGQEHLRRGVLSAVGPAFSEDPLRVLRGVQFASRFGMVMDDATAEASRRLKDEIETLPLERIWGEFEKIGAKGQDFKAPARVIEQVGLQGRFGNIRPATPNLEGLQGEQRIAVALTSIGADPTRIGATNNVTRRMQELDKALNFSGSIEDSRAFARTMKLSTFGDAVRIDPFLTFDPAVRNGPTTPIISGKDLTAIGMKPGPAFGRILNEVTAAQDRGEITTKEQAIERVRALTASADMSTIVAACHSRACAPPPTGKGGSDLIKKVRSVLTDDLRQAPYKGSCNPMTGHCYVAAEALYHAMGGKEAGLTPHYVRHEGAPHWFLKHKDGAIIDPTADQFKTPVPYDKAKGKGFLTRKPSKRAREVLRRANLGE